MLLLATWYSVGLSDLDTSTLKLNYIPGGKSVCVCGNELNGAVDCNKDTLEVRLASYYCISYSEELLSESVLTKTVKLTLLNFQGNHLLLMW